MQNSSTAPQPSENTIKLFPTDPNQVSDFVRRIIVDFNTNGLFRIKVFKGIFVKGDPYIFSNFITYLFQREMSNTFPKDVKYVRGQGLFGYNEYMKTILDKQIMMESSANPNAVGGLYGSYYGRSYGLLQVSGVFIANFKSNGLLPQDFEPNFNSKVPVNTAFYESIQLWLAWMAQSPTAMLNLWHGNAYAYGLAYNGGVPYAEELGRFFASVYPSLIV